MSIISSPLLPWAIPGVAPPYDWLHVGILRPGLIVGSQASQLAGHGTPLLLGGRPTGVGRANGTSASESLSSSDSLMRLVILVILPVMFPDVALLKRSPLGRRLLPEPMIENDSQRTVLRMLENGCGEGFWFPKVGDNGVEGRI